MKKKIRNIIFAIFCVLFVPVLIFNCILMVKTFIHPDEVPGFFGYKPMIVMSASMEDTIMTGDLIFAKECDPNTLKVDDIISYRDSENTIITHRIIEVVPGSEGNRFVTKGDNNNAEDSEYVNAGQVEGKYVSRIAKLGSFLEFIQTPVGIAISLLSIAVICLIIIICSNKSWSYDAIKVKEEN